MGMKRVLALTVAEESDSDLTCFIYTTPKHDLQKSVLTGFPVPPSLLSTHDEAKKVQDLMPVSCALRELEELNGKKVEYDYETQHRLFVLVFEDAVVSPTEVFVGELLACRDLTI